MGCSHSSPQGWGLPGGAWTWPQCQAPAPKGGDIGQGIADGQPQQPGDPLSTLQAAGGKCGLSKNCCLHMCRGLRTCTGAISTAQLGSRYLLSHGNLPARGGVIKRLSPFPSRLRVSPPWPRLPQHHAGTCSGRIAPRPCCGVFLALFGVKLDLFAPI